jgi:hypothetical protein
MATCVWGLVEDYLCNVLIAATRPHNEDGLTKAFYAIVATDGKIKMTDAAVSVALLGRTRLLARWGTLVNRLNRKRRLRNELAHCQVVTRYGKDDDVFLVPFFNLHDYSALRALSDADAKLHRLYVADVKQRADGFEEMRFELQEFAKRLTKQRRRQRKAPEQAVAPRKGSRRSTRRTPKEPW